MANPTLGSSYLQDPCGQCKRSHNIGATSQDPPSRVELSVAIVGLFDVEDALHRLEVFELHPIVGWPAELGRND
jgi:hypothetical protein